ncbi:MULTISPECIES: hypothetical protein [Photorhabdus]|uniref:DUF695 domain-containing protein n=2 Tax=Photorhabdus TaxID=29487 RepID=A0ABX0ASK5_9GAMM|nr:MULTISPECIES: hypothetical protein [Photorhabdus]MCC8373951.1 hypothetical protein [Photorhabdus bodei]MCT8350961.1 hypothetical protein [Photorhabdus kayaii]MDB6371087.1 hypothetical protein [Photorhabdus bodei]NDL10375.1 hypothetical protein [Photorhabdus kayaii]NDL23753.1 hypothetical protein [Photorhabdus kayaii]
MTKYHSLKNKTIGGIGKISSYDIEFTFNGKKPQTFRLVFFPLTDDVVGAERIAEVYDVNPKILFAVSIIFFDQAYELIPTDELNGRTPFDKIDKAVHYNRNENNYFFNVLISYILDYIEESKVHYLYFSGYSDSHKRTYERLLQKVQSRLILEYEDLGGGDYVVKTCYSNQEEGNSG